MYGKILFTFAVAFVIVFFSIFNTAPVEIRLWHFRNMRMPLSLLVFCMFVAGMVYIGAITMLDGMRQSRAIRKMKKQIESLTEIIQKQQETISANNKEEQTETAQLPEKEPAVIKAMPDKGAIKKPKNENEIKSSNRPEKEKHIVIVKELSNIDIPKLSAEPEDTDVFEEPKIEDESEPNVEPDEEQMAAVKHPKNDKFSLSAEEREIALRRIQNG